MFGVDQLVPSGEVAPRPLLASMRYHPAAGEIPDSDQMLPWQADAPHPVRADMVEHAGSIGDPITG